MKTCLFKGLGGGLLLALLMGVSVGMAAPETLGGGCGGFPSELGIDRISPENLPGILRSALSVAGNDRLRLHQVATLALYWSVWETFPVARVRLFPILGGAGHLTLEAREFFFGQWAVDAGMWGDGKPVPADRVDAFEKMVKDWPSSEQFVAAAIFRNQGIHASRFTPEQRAYFEGVIEIAEIYAAGEAADERPFEPMQVALQRIYGDAQHTVLTFSSFTAYREILKIYAPRGEVPFELQPLWGIPRRHQLIAQIAQGVYSLPVAFPDVLSLLEPNGHYRGGFGSFILTFEHAVKAAIYDIPKPIFRIIPRLYDLVDRYALALQTVQKFEHRDERGKHLGFVMDSTVAVEHAQLHAVQLSLTDLYFSSVNSSQVGSVVSNLRTWLQGILLVNDICLERKEVDAHIPGGGIGLINATGPTLLAWVVVDMAKHPEIYEAAGMDMQAMVQELGPEAQALYRAIAYNDSDFFKDDLERSKRFREMAWDIYRLLD